VNSSGGLFVLRPSHFDAGTCILAQFIAQTAKGDVESLCCMSSIAAAVSKRTNDMCSYCLGESGIIVYDRHDLTFIFGAVMPAGNGSGTLALLAGCGVK